MYNRILVPVAETPSATAARQYVQRFPAREVVLLRVEPDFQVLAPGPLSDFRPDWREVRAAQVRDELNDLKDQLGGHSGAVEVEVRFNNDVASEILAMSAGADLIVMTTRARSVSGRALFGSTADRVARHALVPVLLIRTGEETPAPAMPGRIAVPLDGSERAEAALPVATKLAMALGLPLQLVRVVDTVGVEPDMQDHARAECEAAAYLQDQAARLTADGLTVDQVVLAGAPAFVLLDLASLEDIVVMTSHGRGGIMRWVLGSVAEKLVREADAPVLLVPSAGRGAAG